MKANSESKTTTFDAFTSVFLAGILIGIIGLVLNGIFGSQIFYTLAICGGMIALLPFLGFQIAMTANEAGPGTEVADMKHLWFWCFYLFLFPVINLVFFIGVNYLLKISPAIINIEEPMSLTFFKITSPYVAIISGILIIIGLIRRLIKKNKNVCLV